jgi:transcriptional/translational regulatory protein YebC/TACO1
MQKGSGLYQVDPRDYHAARESEVDPETNFKLRFSDSKAREGSMPKDNIERQ